MNNSFLRFIDEASDLLLNFPDLELFSQENSVPILGGKIILYDDNKNIIDQYEVRIMCSEDYPKSFPLVYETSKRLPHNNDWHIYNDGHFCICTPLEEQIHCSKGINLSGFIKDHLTPYLFNQKFREENGYFLNERSHGPLGIFEFLFQKTKCKTKERLCQIISYVIHNPEPNRVAKCFCGSNLKYRYCHRDTYRDLKRVKKEDLSLMLDLLEINNI